MATYKIERSFAPINSFSAFGHLRTGNYYYLCIMRSIFTLLLIFIALNCTAKKHLVSYEKVSTYSIADLKQTWKENGVLEAIAPIDNAVDVYEIIYESTWIDGSPVKCSGIFYQPRVNAPLPLVMYFHGTQIRKARKIKMGGEQAICIGFGVDGYAVGYVDYFGIGKGERQHLYQHAETEAIAGRDLVRAIRELQGILGFRLNNNIYSTGYSQGGHASMAFHKFSEEQWSEEINIAASSPMSGAYDMAGAQSKVMFVEYSHPGYLPYLLSSYNLIYDMYDDFWNTIFKEPYNTLLPPLFDGKHSMGDVNSVIPSVPSACVKDEWVKAYHEDPNFLFKQKLEENATFRFKPKAPMQICYCDADEQVYYENAFVAADYMKELGAKNVLLRRVGKKYDHNTCALFAAMYTKFFFNSVEKKGKTEKGAKGPVGKRFLLSIAKLFVD